MSTTDAIGDLTTLLAAHLDDAIAPFAGAQVTTLPVDRAQPGERQNRLNLFLSHVVTNGAFSNLPMPGTHPGADGRPPLPLNLHYLLTFLGEDDLDPQGTVAQKMLGSVMRLLLDQPELRRERIQSLVPESRIDQQVDLVRLTSRPLTLEEISRLWPAFQTPYRLSIALEASCVLIESLDDRPSPMPVLRRGESDLGPVAVTGLPFPVIERIVVGPAQTPFPAVRIGDTVTVAGQRLQAGFGQEAVLRVRDASGSVIADVPTEPGPRSTLRARILATYPGLPAPIWRAEALTMSVVIREPGEDDQSSNEVVIGMAPKVTAIAVRPPGLTVGATTPIEVQANDPDDVTLSVEFAPPVFPTQAITAWWGRQPLERVSDDAAGPIGVHEFRVGRPASVPAGVLSAAAPVRVRVGRVDSVPARVVAPPGNGIELDTSTMVAVRWS